MFAIDTTYQSVKPSRFASLISFHSKTSNIQVGDAGERLAILMLEQAGYKAWKPSISKAGDVHASHRITGEFFSIEVKTSVYSETSKKWQFCLKRGKKTDLTHSDYILLFLVDKNSHFSYLIPTAFLENMTQLSITARPSRYRGKVAPFLVRGALSFAEADNVLGLLQ